MINPYAYTYMIAARIDRDLHTRPPEDRTLPRLRAPRPAKAEGRS